MIIMFLKFAGFSFLNVRICCPFDEEYVFGLKKCVFEVC